MVFIFRWQVAASGGGWREKYSGKGDRLLMTEASFPVPGLPLNESYPATWVPGLPPATRNKCPQQIFRFPVSL